VAQATDKLRDDRSPVGELLIAKTSLVLFMPQE